jgi:cytoskeletal protein CcmA (bactofilin family)
LFGKSGSANGAVSGSVTIIGAGVRVEGNISFAGFLRIHGDVVGDISCGSDSNGTTVVQSSGSVTGSIKTPHIIIGGRVHGPLDASESIEIHPDAVVNGDASYKQFSIEPGGVIEGALIPKVPMGGGQSRPDRRVHGLPTDVIKESGLKPANDRRSTAPFGRKRKLVAAAVVIAVVAAVWISRKPAPVAPHEMAVTPELEFPVKSAPVTQFAPVEREEVQAAQKPVVVEPAPAVPEKHAEAKVVAPPPVSAVPPATPPSRPRPETNVVVTVNGMDWDKPADFFYVEAKEPSVMYKKQRDDLAEGMRIDLPQGARKRVAISENQLVRLAQGRNVDVFFQGRKVSRATVESGAWMVFVPQPAGATTP